MPKEIPITTLRKKEGRGKLLIIVLVLYVLFIIFNTGAASIDALLDAHSPLLYKAEYAVILPLNILIFIGLLKWKKLAIYGFFLLPMIQLIFIGAVLIPKSTYLLTFLATFTSIIFICIPLSIPFFIFKKKWHLFN